MKQADSKLLLGWREWVALPALGISRIKAKVDTGARTSALHAFELRPFTENGRDRIEFLIHPRQNDNETYLTCVGDIIDRRIVSDSGGHKEERYVIESPVRLGDREWPVEMTLTARDDMRFRMLLGRTAINDRAIVDPARSYLLGKKRRK